MAPAASFAGIPLSLISLVTLTVQNSALTVVLHYSRISVPADRMYSAASAVLLNELLKGAISLSIAFRNSVVAAARPGDYARIPSSDDDERKRALQGTAWSPETIRAGGAKMLREVFSRDCWKLSIPACLYVIQNNLQFVAASNLDVPTFQVTYNLKILTTALFSVFLLGRRLSAQKWAALLFLAAGVGVVQLQSTTSNSSHDSHDMDKAKGLFAVFCACMTSGLAGVYFEMVLKGSKADLWIRNVQLSFFSLLPALMAVFAPGVSLVGGPAKPNPTAGQPIFANFGGWAWAVVSIQVFGGLVTALVIRYSDNIMKGFATSLAIVLSFCAGIILFDFNVTLSFLVGSAMVVASTYLYNLPDAGRRALTNSSPLPSTLPSPSLAKGPFTPAYPQPRHITNNSLSSPPPPPLYTANSALATLRASDASSSSTSPSLSNAGSTANRRPPPQSVHVGAQTPEYSVNSVFQQVHRRGSTEAAGSDTSLIGSGGGGGGVNPCANPGFTAQNLPRSGSMPDLPVQQAPMQQSVSPLYAQPYPGAQAGERYAASMSGQVGQGLGVGVAGGESGEGTTSGRSTPQSPDQIVRSRSPLRR